MRTSWDLYESTVAAVAESSKRMADHAGPSVWKEPVADLSMREEALAKRRAEKHFSEDNIDGSILGTLDAAVHAADTALWPSAHVLAPLELLVYASRVDGVDPGIYRLQDDLRRIPRPAHVSANDLVLQPEFAGAAAIVVIIGSIKDAANRSPHGEHGYRLLLTRAGAAAETVWFTALKAGLGASIFAGILPSVLRATAGVDGFTRVQLIAVAIGHPAQRPAALG